MSTVPENRRDPEKYSGLRSVLVSSLDSTADSRHRQLACASEKHWVLPTALPMEKQTASLKETLPEKEMSLVTVKFPAKEKLPAMVMEQVLLGNHTPDYFQYRDRQLRYYSRY